jgi:hypothetical protein
MKTKMLLVSSAIFMGIIGISLIFFPQDIFTYSKINCNGTGIIYLQIMGALYLSFSMINWTAKSNITGGIYNRPITLGNFSHFLIGAFVLMKGIFSVNFSKSILIICIIYVIFSILFGSLLFGSPIKKNELN